ncbi:MAG: hypothetical protein Q4P72_06480, partial [Eubacteriales bacterium]|nr:hypothetical protein [Eubacteriales bacterium]
KPASRLARSEYPPENFVPLQAEILDAGARLLKPGGVLVYSTCTFNLAENEAQVLAFLERHPDFELDDGLPHFPAGSGLDRGFPYEGQELLKRCLRIFPHHCEGEGHFAARFIRRSAETCLSSPRVLNSKAKRPKKARKSGQGTNLKLALEAYQNFLSQNHCGDAEGESYFLLDDTLVEAQIPPEELPKSAGIHCLHSGLSLGQVKIDRRGRARFVPDPLLALSKPIEFFGQRLELKPASDALRKLLQGQTLSLEDLPEAAAFDASYFLASYRGFGLSLLKREGSQIKNLFPAYFHGRALDLVQILAAGTSGEPSIEEDDE